MGTLQQAAQTNLHAGQTPRPNHVVINPITIVGALIACVGLGGAGFALVAGFLDEDPSAVKGILGYVVMPNVALLGVLVMAAGVLRGAWRAARAAAAAGESRAVRIDVGGLRQLFGIAAFAGIAVGSLLVLGGTAYRGIEFTESTTFCGTCHTVMQPQVEAHLTAPHAEVECAKCHVAYRASPLGPNVTAYVNSKIGGMRQMLAVMTDSYDRPVRAPASAIPDTNHTCQGCHPAGKDYGVVLREYNEYATDDANTRHPRLLAFNVDTGSAQSANTSGFPVHWHATAKLYYTATNASRSTISWVGVEGADGGLEQWTNPKVPLAAGEPAASQRQLMSCIDCHNRVGHLIPSPDALVDDALEHGRIDRTLPYVKREAVSLLGGTGGGANPDVLAADFSRSGWFDQLAKFYADNYPEIAATRQPEIRNAIDELQKISKQILYPDMKADWLTYPDNLSHNLPAGIKTSAGQDTPGCFRCHGTLVNVKTGQMLPGTMGGEGCLACHAVSAGSGTIVGPVDPTKTQTCSYCHVTIEQQALGMAIQTSSDASAPDTEGFHNP